MAKRAPAGDAAYNPLDENLANSVINQAVLLRRGVSDAAIATLNKPEIVPNDPSSNTPGDSQSASSGQRGFTRAKRVLLTPEEERHIERLVDRMAEHAGTSLKFSHVLRACMAVLCHAEVEIIRQAANASPRARPANGDFVALAQFEQGIARLLSLALREAPPLR